MRAMAYVREGLMRLVDNSRVSRVIVLIDKNKMLLNFAR